VLICHGFADHLGRYQRASERWLEAGLSVLRFDFRGHGRSAGKRGHILSFDDYLHDFRDACQFLASHPQAGGVPTFVFAHSTGALVALHAVPEYAKLAGLAMSSPYLRLKFPAPRWKTALGAVMSRVWPSFSQPTLVEPAAIAGDEAVVHARKTDPMGFEFARARWFTETLRAQAELASVAPRVTLPVLCLQAGDDVLTDPEASREWMERLGSKDVSYEELSGCKHELLNERDWQPLADRYRDWFLVQARRASTD
jgi:lysophospholipase